MLMKKVFLFYFVLLVFPSCEKIEIDEVNFEVSVKKTEYTVGENVVFSFSGNPDYIAFYSGETGKEYDLRERQPESGEPVISFTSLKTGNPNAKISLYISTDFNGKYDQESVRKAVWADLSNQAVFSTGADNTNSGDINLKSYNSGLPVYLAFVSKKPEDNLNQVFTHSLRTLEVKNVLADGSVYNINPSVNFTGWKTVDFTNNAVLWAVNASNQLVINSIVENRNLENEDWAVSGPIELNRVIPDKGTHVKSMAMTMPLKYNYAFTQKGLYKVTFVAYNQTMDNKKEVIKELTIKVN